MKVNSPADWCSTRGLWNECEFRTPGKLLIAGSRLRALLVDKPCDPYVKDGAAVSGALSYLVEMHYREAGIEKAQHLAAGDVCFAEAGDEHVAHPLGEARILVIEKPDGL